MFPHQKMTRKAICLCLWDQVFEDLTYISNRKTADGLFFRSRHHPQRVNYKLLKWLSSTNTHFQEKKEEKVGLKGGRKHLMDVCLLLRKSLEIGSQTKWFE